MPRSGAGLTISRTPGAWVPGRTTARTGSQPPARAASIAPSSSRRPAPTRSPLGVPIRVPDPAARMAAATCRGPPRSACTTEHYAGAGQTDHARGMQPVAEFADPAALAAALDSAGYLPDTGLATGAYLAMRMHRPLFLEGAPGVGKTALAHALATVTGSTLVRLQCYEGIDASQALYDWDFPRQILHLRALEAAGADGDGDVQEAEKSLCDERFLLARPVLSALQQSPAVLLVDEVDRADDEFEAFLLEVLSTYRVSIPELGPVAAAVPPVGGLPSNRTRELHDALKRRCLYHWIDHPGLEREVAIVRSRAPEVSEALARQVVGVVQGLRDRGDLQKPPGVAETLDWARALTYLGTAEIDLAAASATLGPLVKYREDADRVRQALDPMLRP